MFQEAGSIKVVVLRSICDRPAHGGARHDLFARILPLHRQWREVPAGRSWYAGAIGVRSLVAGRTRESRYAHPRLSAHNVKTMSVTVIALLRKARGRVAVDAAWMGEDRIHLLPGGETFVTRCLTGRRASAGRDEDDRAPADQEPLTALHALTVALLGSARIVETCSIDVR